MWDENMVSIRLEQASQTERILPDRDRHWLVCRSHWPDYVKDWFRGAVDWHGKTRCRLQPTARQISQMEECIEWVGWLSQSQHKDTVALSRIVWARAQGYSYRKIGSMVGKSDATCKRWNCIGLHYIVARLNKQNV